MYPSILQCRLSALQCAASCVRDLTAHNPPSEPPLDPPTFWVPATCPLGEPSTCVGHDVSGTQAGRWRTAATICRSPSAGRTVAPGRHGDLREEAEGRVGAQPQHPLQLLR